MKTINLRWMYPHYRHDEFVDVTDRGMGSDVSGQAGDGEL